MRCSAADAGAPMSPTSTKAEAYQPQIPEAVLHASVPTSLSVSFVHLLLLLVPTDRCWACNVLLWARRRQHGTPRTVAAALSSVGSLWQLGQQHHEQHPHRSARQVRNMPHLHM